MVKIRVYISITFVTLTSILKSRDCMGMSYTTNQSASPPMDIHVFDESGRPHYTGVKRDPLTEMSAEKLLLNVLLNNYDRIGRPGRPVLNITTTTEVIFALGLIQMDLDEKDNILTMSMWTRYQWRDEYLTWDPTLYDGIQAIRVEPERIWIPDITLYNTADAEAPARSALAVISPDGVVTWYPHTIFKSSCSIDVSNFPFDQQKCHMWFGSWTHTSREIDLRMDVNHGIDLATFKSDYKESSAWDIVNVSARRRIMPSLKDDPNYVVLMFDLAMKRKVVFSSYILTLPCIFLAFLTLVVFWLPPDRPDRTGLAMSTFSSFMLLLLILVETAPPTASSIPTLGIYYCFNLVIIMLSIILSSMVVNVSRGTSSDVPRWLRLIVLEGIGRLTCHRRAPKARSPPVTNPSEADTETLTMLQNLPNGSAYAPTSPTNRSDDSYFCENLPEGFKSILRNLDLQVGEIKRILQVVQFNMDERQGRERARGAIREQWVRIGMILDRFFFFFYIFLIIISLTLLFPKPP